MNTGIIKPFKILNQILVFQKIFESKEFTPNIEFHFQCKNCNEKQTVELVPFKSGKPLSNLYKTNNFISIEELKKNGVAKPAQKWQSHLGELILSNIPALYKIINCSTCHESYLIVFGFGESQPSRMICEISGIWLINYLA